MPAYNADGLRTGKTVGSVTHNYFYAGGQLLRETCGSNVLDFSYDANGYPYALIYNGTPYYYITNLQGDVMYLVDSTGATVASYEYDPYGNIISATGEMAEVNPLRYRGYYYDAELGMYYLQSRYYDPTTGRFINADSLVSTGTGLLGNNMFVYCLNNPINYVDITGNIAQRCYSLFKTICEYICNEIIDYLVDNAYFKIEGMINGQGVFPYADTKCGLGTYAKNGCGIIAVYNAMQLLGKPRSLGSIEARFQYKYGMILWGMGGVSPGQIGSYFDAQGVSYAGYGSYNKMLRNLTEGDVIVFTVMNDKSDITKGFHTMAAQYQKGKFIVYNISNTRTSSKTVSSLDPVYGNSCWIYGYIVGG